MNQRVTSLHIRRMMSALGTFTKHSLVKELKRLYPNSAVRREVLLECARVRIDKLATFDHGTYRWIEPPDHRVQIIEPTEKPVDLADFSHPESEFWRDQSKAAKQDGPQANA